MIMKSDGKNRRNGLSPSMERIVSIARDHIHYARRHPHRLSQVAQQLGVSTDSALALAISDQILEEYTLAERGVTPE
jgi:hypothetical protein